MVEGISRQIVLDKKCILEFWMRGGTIVFVILGIILFFCQKTKLESLWFTTTASRLQLVKSILEGILLDKNALKL